MVPEGRRAADPSAPPPIAWPYERLGPVVIADNPCLAASSSFADPDSGNKAFTGRERNGIPRPASTTTELYTTTPKSADSLVKIHLGCQWDAVVVPDHASYFISVSHHGWIRAVSRDLETTSRMREALGAWKPLSAVP